MSAHAASTNTGLSHAKLGTWAFLASEVMLFGGLISAYVILRSGSGHFFVPPRAMMGVPLATLNTFVLISSSVTMVLAIAAIQAGNVQKLKNYLLCTIGGGAIFLCIKAYEYNHKWHEGITISASLFGSFYYTLTGLHMFHVIGGMGLLGFIYWEASRGHFTAASHDRVECSGLYWHLVDLVWVLLFPILYLL